MSSGSPSSCTHCSSSTTCRPSSGCATLWGPIIGANLDPSHLFWQQMDPLAVIRVLGEAVFHVHLKDTTPEPERMAIAGVLDQRLARQIRSGHGTSGPWGSAMTGRTGRRSLGPANGRLRRRAQHRERRPYQEGEEGVRQAAAFIQPLLTPRRAPDYRLVRLGRRPHRLRQHRHGASRRLGRASRGIFPVAVADPTPERLEIGRATAGLEPSDAYRDYRDLIARDDVGVVDVCVPPRVRREIVIAAAQAGKHILSEKPLATVPSDAAAMVEAAT